MLDMQISYLVIQKITINIKNINNRLTPSIDK